jgi:hypothetical protein
MPASAIGAIGSALLGSAASALVGGLVNKKSNSPAATPAPKVETPTVMPDPLAQKDASRRKAAVSMSRQLTAANTVLTGGDTKLGA